MNEETERRTPSYRELAAVAERMAEDFEERMRSSSCPPAETPDDAAEPRKERP